MGLSGLAVAFRHDDSFEQEPNVGYESSVPTTSTRHGLL